MEMHQSLPSGQRSVKLYGLTLIQAIQPPRSETIFCNEKMQNGQNQWITSFSEQMI